MINRYALFCDQNTGDCRGAILPDKDGEYVKAANPDRLPTKSLCYEIYLRPDFKAQLVMPSDLTETEFTRLTALLKACVMPEIKHEA